MNKLKKLQINTGVAHEDSISAHNRNEETEVVSFLSAEDNEQHPQKSRSPVQKNWFAVKLNQKDFPSETLTSGGSDNRPVDPSCANEETNQGNFLSD